MTQRNRERIMQQSMYDLLIDMNKQLMENNATAEIPPDKECEMVRHCDACIMDCFMESVKAYDRCCSFFNDCGSCLQAWLNEYPF